MSGANRYLTAHMVAASIPGTTVAGVREALEADSAAGRSVRMSIGDVVVFVPGPLSDRLAEIDAAPLTAPERNRLRRRHGAPSANTTTRGSDQ